MDNFQPVLPPKNESLQHYIFFFTKLCNIWIDFTQETEILSDHWAHGRMWSGEGQVT